MIEVQNWLDEGKADFVVGPNSLHSIHFDYSQTHNLQLLISVTRKASMFKHDMLMILRMHSGIGSVF